MFRTEFTPVVRNRSFRSIVSQQKFKLTFHQLRDPQEEPLGEALTEAIVRGLRRLVANQGFNVRDDFLLMAVHPCMVAIRPTCTIRRLA